MRPPALRPLVIELQPRSGPRLYLARGGWTPDPRQAWPLPPWWARRYEAWLRLQGLAARVRRQPA